MTNADKYLKEGVAIKEFAVEITKRISRWDELSYYSDNIENDIIDFLSTEIKPTLEDGNVKEMVYTKERKREVLATGYYFGLLYYVLSLGTHPTAYVEIPKDNWLCTVENYEDIPIKCHGGITFRDDHLHIADNQEIEGEFIGWDYAHCTDYAPYYDEVLSKGTHKWTTKEILKEVKDVCSQIVELGKKPHLTKDERVILMNIDKNNTHIGRDKIYGLFVYNCIDGAKEYTFDNMFNHLFQFIKEGEEYSIEELLKGE